jgi:hypothetical protein
VYWRKNLNGKEVKKGIYRKIGRKLEIDKTALFPEQVQIWFDEQFRLNGDEDEIFVQIFTELTLLQDGEKTIVRAHPNYSGNGEWHDYVGIYYDQAKCDLPARCACFFYEPDRETVGDNDLDAGRESEEETKQMEENRQPGERYMLVQECYYQTALEKRNSAKSLLFNDYRLQGVSSEMNTNRVMAKLACRECSNINNRLFCIDPEPNNGGAFWKSIEGNRREDNIFKIVLIRERQTEWVNLLLQRMRQMTGRKAG